MKPKNPRNLGTSHDFRCSSPALVLAGAVSLLALRSAHAQATWVGDTSQDWNIAANWSSDPAAPAGNFTINNATAGVHPILNANTAFTPTDVLLGDGASTTGRLDHTVGALTQSNVSDVGNWFFAGRNGGSGTYNLANTAVTGQANLTTFGQGAGSITVGKLFVGGGYFAPGGTGTVNINTSGSLTANSAQNFGGQGTSSMVVGFGGGSGTMKVDSGTINATGIVDIAAGTDGTQNSQGTLSLGTGAVFNSEGDFRTGYAGGATTQATVNVNGGTLNIGSTALRWMIVGQWDSTNSTVNVNSGNLNLNGNTALRMKIGNNGGGTNIVNLNGGGITSYSDNQTTPNGVGVVDLMQAGTASTTNTFNLNGGTLRIREVITTSNTGIATFNFNGGTLKATGTTASLVNLGGAAQTAKVRDNGAIIDSNGFDVGITQALEQSDSGTGGLTKLGAGTLTLSGSNTYTGNTNVAAGRLTLADNAGLKFVLGASGVNNKITGTGAVQLDGDFTIITTGASTTAGSTWQIVDVTNLAETYGPTFSIVGATESLPGVWLVGAYRFTKSTGVVEVVADSDGDGLPDLYEDQYFGNNNGIIGSGELNIAKGDATQTGLPGNPDSDGDGFSNLAEFNAGSNPANRSSTPGDFDGDTLSNEDEISGTLNAAYGSVPTSPTNPDSDGDGLRDDVEINTHGTNPNSIDTDGDGLTDNNELAVHGTNPTLADSDFDTWSDPAELNLGTDPNDTEDHPDVPVWTFALIDNSLRNGGFESLTIGGTETTGSAAKATDWDTDPDGDVTDWTLWTGVSTANGDSGAEVIAPHYATAWCEGSRAAFWQPGNASYNMTTHVAAEGELFHATWNTAGFIGGGGSGKITAWLVYDNAGVPARIDLATDSTSFSSGLLQTGRLIYKIPAGSPAIGKTIGIGFSNPSAEYVALDQIALGFLPANPDSDADGLPDLYEDQYFGDNTAPTTPVELARQGGSGDADGDGTDNLTELRLGLIPNDGGSTFTASRDAATGQLTWPSRSGLTFTVWRSTTLAADGWVNLTLGGIPGEAGSTSFTDPTPPAEKAFYSIHLDL